VVTLISPAERDPPETRGVLLRDFVDAFERAERDAHSDLNPGGACDLTRAESRLLEGKESARGWALGGIERAAPTTGAELKMEAARVLVDAGFGTPFVDGWLDPKWLTVLNIKHEAAAVEHVVEACVEACHRANDDESKTVCECYGVVVVAPYRPAWPSSSFSKTVVVAADPESFAGDVTKALDCAERCLKEKHDVKRVAAVVFGNPSPITGRIVSSRLVSAVYAWCDERNAHAVADETASLAADAFRDDDDDDDDDDTYHKNVTTADIRDIREGITWGRAAGFASATSLWSKKAHERRHAVAAFGAAGGTRRGKTTVFLITRSSSLRTHVSGDPFAAQLQGLLADGGVAARDSFSFHNALLRERRRFAVARLARLAVATGPVGGEREKKKAAVSARAEDGGLHVWVDLRDFLDTNSWDAEFRLWDALANTHGVLLVPGSLCGCYDPGFFRVAVAGEFETLREGLDRLERGIRRFVNDDTPHIGG
jgi:hypothetical protein